MDFIFYKQVTDNIAKLNKLGEIDLAETYKNELLNCKSEKDFWKYTQKLKMNFLF